MLIAMLRLSGKLDLELSGNGCYLQVKANLEASI